jgi:hypothetical protein
LLFLLFTLTAVAQPAVELTQDGLGPIILPRPARTNEQLMDRSRGWADTNLKDGYDIYDVTENGLSIGAFRKDAFFYRNLGERYWHNINYTMDIAFQSEQIVITFKVKEIYAKKTLLQNTVADYFMPDGTPKEDMEDVKPSMEATFNRILRSYAATVLY